MIPASAKNQPPKAEKIANYSYPEYDQVINQIYKELPPANGHDLDERIAIISKKFIGSPYILYSLGEGKEGKYDQQPLYRTDGFDCLTFVETVLAIADSNNLESFKHNIISLRYRNEIVKFTNRNHFTSIDWNINNSENGYIKDITADITAPQGKPIVKVSEATINKPKWYKKLPAQRLKQLNSLSPEQSAQLLTELHHQGQTMQKVKSVVTYIPLTELFDGSGKANDSIFAQIPNGAIIEIVRPNGDKVKEIGTHLQISHLGFALKVNNQLIFREASMLEGKVIDIPLSDYLKNYLNSPTVKGISVWLPLGADNHIFPRIA